VPSVSVAPSLTKPGHADHVKFCVEVKGIATAALACFHFNKDVWPWVLESANDDSVDAAVQALQRVVAAIEARQKLIRMADHSNLGWRVVQHYVADPTADSVEDEKRMADFKAVQGKR